MLKASLLIITFLVQSIMLGQTIPEIRDHIYCNIPESYKVKKKDKIAFEFADIQAYHINKFKKNKRIYTNEKYREYLTKIANQVIPKDIMNQGKINIYLYKDGELNCFALASGDIFINVGMITACKDEQTIAGSIAHEIAHFTQLHGLRTHFNRNLGEYSNGFYYQINKELEFSIKMELEADSVAFKWLSNSPYGTEALNKALDIVYKEEKRKKHLRHYNPKEHSSHPNPEHRYNIIDHYNFSANETLYNKRFLVDSLMFNNLKEWAKLESLKSLLLDFKNSDCLEQALLFESEDPNNQEYLFYLLESIRRLGYLNYTIWNSDFISYRYVDDYLHQLNQTIDIEGLNTYNDYFQHFYKTAIKSNCTECILSNILNFARKGKTDNTKKLIGHYLNQETALNKGYIDSYNQNQLLKDLPNRKLKIITKFEVLAKQGKSKIPLRPQNSTDIELIMKLAQNNTYYLNYLPDSLDYSVKLNNLSNLIDVSHTLKIGDLANTKQKLNVAQLSVLSPELFKVYQNFGVNEIEFINIKCYISFKKARTKEEYLNLISTNLNELFLNDKRSASIVISRKKMVQKDGEMSQIQDNYAEIMLNSKSNLHSQLQAIIDFE